MSENTFLNKNCKLIKRDGFVLYGIPREITSNYVIFETNTKTSMIGFIDIKELSEDNNRRL
jgi:hypothetical protein